MSAMDAELSAAVTAYLHRGDSSWPRDDQEAARSVASGTDPDHLVARVLALVQETQAVSVDWSTLSLNQGGDVARAEVSRRHPELSPEALDALRWSFTYHWR